MKQLPHDNQSIHTRYARLHRAYWNHQLNAGIAKIHCPTIGVFSVLVGEIVEPIDLSDALAIQFARAQFKSNGANLAAGFNLEKDTEVIKTLDYDNWVFYPSLRFRMHKEKKAIALGDGGWHPFNAPIWEYQPITSLIGI